MNRQQLIAYRSERRRLEAARQARVLLIERLQQLEEQVQALTAQVTELKRGDSHP